MKSPLSKLTSSQWEALCDGCARCCVVKLEDEDTGDIYYTDVACRYLDLETGRCTDYPNRSAINPDCVTLSKNNLSLMALMPSTCAYRRTHENRPVLLDARTLSICGKVISEEVVREQDLEDHIIDWISTDY